MSCERALNFDQWKTISENYEPMRVWSWLVYKFAYNYCHLRLFSKFIQTQEVSYLSWPNMYPNMKTTCHIKLKFFMWTKLLENLLLAKYLISVTAPLRWRSQIIVLILLGDRSTWDIEILGWCPAGPVLSYGEKVPL